MYKEIDRYADIDYDQGFSNKLTSISAAFT